MIEPGWKPDSLTHSGYVGCIVFYTPKTGRKKVFVSLHYISRGKCDFSPYLSYFSQFALLSLEAGGLYQGKQREMNNPKQCQQGL